METTKPDPLLLIVVGITAIASAIALAVFFIVGGPFGAVNDVLNAVLAVLSAYLAWGLGGSSALTYVTVLGAAIALVGSALVIFGVTGFFLAGLVSSLGFALIGAWLFVYCLSSSAGAAPRWLGLLAGGLMAFGIVVIPGIVMRLDDMNSAPWWIWVGFASWLGIYVAYPAWSIWSGITKSR